MSGDADHPDPSDRSVDVAPGRRAWIVMVLDRPRGNDAALRELLRTLRKHGARRVSPGVLLAPDAEGLREELRYLSDRVVLSGGRVLIADSVIVDGRERGGERGR